MKPVKTQTIEEQQSSQSDQVGFLDSYALRKLQLQKNNSLVYIQQIKSKGKTECHYLLKAICNQKKLSIQEPQTIRKYLQKRVQKIIRNKQLKRNWSVNDIQILLWMISQNLKKNSYHQIDQLKQSDWKQISDLIPGSKPKSCMMKFLSLKKTNLTQLRWSHNQSLILKHLAQKHDKNWKKISEQLYFQGKQKVFRTPKQCRQHWSSFINPLIKKSPWSIEQDFLLFYHILIYHGEKRWVQIKQNIHSRTQNALKNRYVLLIQKSKKQNAQLSQRQLIILNLCRLIQIDFEHGDHEKQIKNIKAYYRNQVYPKLSFPQKASMQQEVKIQQFQQGVHQAHIQDKIQIQKSNQKIGPQYQRIQVGTRQIGQICRTKDGFYTLSERSIPE